MEKEKIPKKQKEEILLLTKDSVTIRTKKKYFYDMSLFIKKKIDEGNKEETRLILIPDTSEKIVKKIIDYCEYHWDNKAKKIKKPLKYKFENVICEWDRKFLEIEQWMLIELISASEYLEIQDLFELTTAKIAYMIKGRSPDEIREMLGIENDFDKEEIKEEYKW